MWKNIYIRWHRIFNFSPILCIHRIIYYNAIKIEGECSMKEDIQKRGIMIKVEFKNGKVKMVKKCFVSSIVPR